jgi:hypothetical protein
MVATNTSMANGVAVAATTAIEDANNYCYYSNNVNIVDNTRNDNVFVRGWKKLRAVSAVDKQTIAKLGIAFGLTYNIISNINGSISLSVAWYMASRKVRSCNYMSVFNVLCLM